MWSVVNININASQVSTEPIPESLIGYGGKSFITNYVTELVDKGLMNPKCDPLGPENPLIICNGIFSGTVFSTDHRLSIGGKSPLTGGIKESSAGGTIAKYMADHGLRAIIVNGSPSDDSFKIIHISKDGSITLENAEEYRFMGNYAFGDVMREKYGKDVAIASIGPAGERCMLAASIQVTEFGEGYPSRAAGRGGMGALMGSKGIKALVIEKAANRYKVEFEDEALFKKSVMEINKLMLTNGKASHYHKVGTIATLDGTAASGVLPVANFSGEMMEDAPEHLGAVPFLATLQERGGCNGKPCQPGCLVQCSNVYNDKDGNYMTSGLEYETIALFGPNCRNKDMDKIALMDHACDDIGVDTIEMGDAAAVAMEAGKIPWGDADGILAMLEDVRNGKDFGLIFGNGCDAVGHALGCPHTPTVKHQALAGYDPRAAKGTGVTYATYPQGADHTGGTILGVDFAADDPQAPAAKSSAGFQVNMTAADSMMCIFAFKQISSRMDLLADMYAAMYGGESDISRITSGLGTEILKKEVAFNRLAGITEKDDRLPEYFSEEKNAGSGGVFDITAKELDLVHSFYETGK